MALSCDEESYPLYSSTTWVRFLTKAFGMTILHFYSFLKIDVFLIQKWN